MSNNNYKNKYFKYKNKYFKYKNQIAGAADHGNIFHIYTTGIFMDVIVDVYVEYDYLKNILKEINPTIFPNIHIYHYDPLIDPLDAKYFEERQNKLNNSDVNHEGFTINSNCIQANFNHNIIKDSGINNKQHIIIDFAGIFSFNQDGTINTQYNNYGGRNVEEQNIDFLNVIRLQHPGDVENNVFTEQGSKCRLFRINLNEDKTNVINIETYVDRMVAHNMLFAEQHRSSPFEFILDLFTNSRIGSVRRQYEEILETYYDISPDELFEIKTNSVILIYGKLNIIFSLLFSDYYNISGYNTTYNFITFLKYMMLKINLPFKEIDERLGTGRDARWERINWVDYGY